MLISLLVKVNMFENIHFLIYNTSNSQSLAKVVVKSSSELLLLFVARIVGPLMTPF